MIDVLEYGTDQEFTYQDSGNGTAQLAFCIWPSRWNMCDTIVGELRSEAYAMTDELGALNGWSRGQRNAFRHSYWMGLVAWEYAPSTAREVGRRHEQDTEKVRLLDVWDSRADAWNNEIGIALADQMQNQTYMSPVGDPPPLLTRDDLRFELAHMVSCECSGRAEWALVTIVDGAVVQVRLDTDVPSG